MRKIVSLCLLVENSRNLGSSFSCYLQQASLQQEERKVTHRQKRKRREKKRDAVMFKSLILVVPESILISPLLTVCLLKSCYVYVKQLPFSSPIPLLLLLFFFLTKLVQARFLSLGNTYYRNIGTNASQLTVVRLPKPLSLGT